MFRFVVKALAFLILPISLLSTGCSPTGWATKELPDGSNLKPGNTVTVLQKDGKEVSGKYVGLHDLAQAEYSAQYNESIDKAGLDRQLPKIGEGVELTTTLSDPVNSRVWAGTLVGFDQQSLWVRLTGEAEPTRFYITGVTTLSNGSPNAIGRMQFRGFFLNGEIPLRTAVVVSTSAGEVSVPLNTIAQVTETDASGLSSVVSLSAGPE